MFLKDIYSYQHKDFNYVHSYNLKNCLAFIDIKNEKSAERIWFFQVYSTYVGMFVLQFAKIGHFTASIETGPTTTSSRSEADLPVELEENKGSYCMSWLQLYFCST